MRVACNKRWFTKDTDESLYAEIIFQYFTDDKKYGDMMGPALSIWLWDPLRFSVAHRFHGFWYVHWMASSSCKPRRP